MILRVLASILLLISVLFLPFWVSIIIALSAMIYFAIFWEAVVLFFLADLLFGAREAKFHGVFFVTFLLSILVLIIVEFAKKKTRFHQ